MYLRAWQNNFLSFGSYDLANKSYFVQTTVRGTIQSFICGLSCWAGTWFQYFLVRVRIRSYSGSLLFFNSFIVAMHWSLIVDCQYKSDSMQFPGFERSKVMQMLAMLPRFCEPNGAYNRLLNSLPPPSSYVLTLTFWSS